MLEFLKKHTFLWDMKSLEYRNAPRKAELWDQLAEDISADMTVAHLKAAFKNLRNVVSKLDLAANKSGSAPRVITGREQQIKDRLQFLHSTVSHRPAPLRRRRTLHRRQHYPEF